MTVLTYVDWASVYRAGRSAYRAGQPTDTCPYSAAGTPAQQEMAFAWYTGWWEARAAGDDRPPDRPVLP